MAAQSGCKWRRASGALAERLKDQAEALDHAATLVKPGGAHRLHHCSVLDDENGAQVRSFAGRQSGVCGRASSEVTTALGEGLSVSAASC